jgi:Fic family protein
VHAQFESIHPFLDGNGRVGRILIPLFLMEKKLISSPVFYISAYIEAHRDIYYEKLNSLPQEKNWESWITFFLGAVIEQARNNAAKATEILNLYDEMKTKVASATRSQFVIQALDAIFTSPIFKSSEFIKSSGIPLRSGLRILRHLEEQGIISVTRKQQGTRPAIMEFTDLLKIVG